MIETTSSHAHEASRYEDEGEVEEKLDSHAKGNLQEQDIFGNEEHAEVKYKVLTWWQCGFLMVAETISLGILSLPAAVASLGLAPAVILIVGLGLLATYTGYVIGQFKWRYPHVLNMGDAAGVILGPVAREVIGIAQLLLLVFVSASHILTFTVAMNSITDHGTCSIVFGVVGLVLSFFLCLPRRLANVSWLSILSFISIFCAVIIAMIGVGIEKPNTKDVLGTIDTNLYKAFQAVCQIVFSFSGNVAFFTFMAELRDPKDYPKALCLVQSIDITLYVVAAVVIYCFAGQDVTSPALGSASVVVRKVAYGIALPTIVIAGVVNGHVACKYVYIRLFRGSDRIHKRDAVSTWSWVAVVFGVWVIAWIIAEAIPVFDSLLSLIASLFASWFTYGFNSIFWFYLNKGKWFSSSSKIVLTMLNIAILCIAGCICGLGLYVSGKALHDNPSSASFSCANNAS